MGMGAVWLSDSCRGRQVGEALESENRSGRQLQMEESGMSVTRLHPHTFTVIKTWACVVGSHDGNSTVPSLQNPNGKGAWELCLL